jgi:hypothetical protein
MIISEKSMVFVLAGVKLLKGWKHPIYVGKKTAKYPGIIDTLIDHGVPRELIREAEHSFTNMEAFDFYARLHYSDNRDERDELAVVLITCFTREDPRFPGNVTGSSDVEIARLPIVSNDYYNWKATKNQGS